MAKKPQTERGMRRRANRADFKGYLCPKHGTKPSTSFLFFRCGCPNDLSTRRG